MKREPNIYLELEKKLAQRTRQTASLEKLNIGKIVRQLREQNSLTGAELCRRGGQLDPRTLTAIEKGRIKNPSFDSLQKIALGLGCLVRDFFTQGEMEFDGNFFRGNQKGFFNMGFPEWGLKVISSTPPISQLFCGKLILAPQREVTGELTRYSGLLFFEAVMGRFEFEVEGKTISLKEGENLFFNGAFKHTFRNMLNRESTLWFVAVPSLFRVQP